MVKLTGEMMSDLINIGKQSILGIVIFCIVYFIGLQLQGLSLEAGVSAAYVDFYSGLIPLCIMGIIAMVVFKVRYFDVFDDILSFKVQVLLVLGWTILIVVMSFSGQQVVPVPRASVEGFQLAPGHEAYLASVIPGVLEDLAYLVGLPMTFAVIALVVLEFGLGIEATATGTVIIMIIAAFVASIGYNTWVIPGFTSAHVPSYGATNPALSAAFFFSAGQSLVYMMTWYFPLPHILHNLIVYEGARTGLVIGPLSVTGVV